MEGTRHRKRVPISCLICRKRKVKCDKVKPTCGGCVRNGVAHLCEYVEPHWVSNHNASCKKDAYSEKPELSSDIDNKLTLLEELKQLKVQNERIIYNQRKEIEDLQRKVSFNDQLSTEHITDRGSTSNQGITVLHRLKPTNVPSCSNSRKLDSHKQSLEILNNGYISIRPNKIVSPMKLNEIHGWLSIIKLDPKLSTLWSKITKMQKIYYSFKQRCVNPSDDQHLNKDPTKQCPVVLIDVDDKTKPANLQDLTIESAVLDQEKLLKAKLNQSLDASRASYLILAKIIQKLWINVVNINGVCRKLNGQQFQFLLNFYFNDHNNTSNRLISWFKDDIQSIVVISNNELVLELNHTIESNNMYTSEGLMKRRSRGVLLCMLLLLLEESLIFFKTKVHNESNDPDTMKFKTLFPVEFLNENDGSTSLNLVQEYLCYIIEPKLNTSELNKSITVISCLLLLIDRDISINIPARSRSTYFNVKLLFNLIFIDNDYILELWKNPNSIVFIQNDHKKKLNDLRIYLAQLWNEILRIINLIIFSIIRIPEYEYEFEINMQGILKIIEDAIISNDHITYLSSFKNSELENLINSFKINYLLVKTHLILTRGIENTIGPNLTVKDVDVLSGDCGSWIEDISTKFLPNLQSIEFKIMLQISSIYLTFVIFLQAEHSKLHELRDYLTTSILAKIRSCIKSTDQLIDKLTISRECQYLFSGILEQYTSLIQIVVAILLRVMMKKDKVHQDDLFKQLSAIYYNSSIISLADKRETNLKSLITVEVTDGVDNLLSKLNNKLWDKSHIKQVISLWNFYKSMIDSSDKLDLNYKKLHSNIPDFKSIHESDFNKCPVSHNGSDKKCPIDHSKLKKRTSKSVSGPSIDHDGDTSKRQKLVGEIIPALPSGTSLTDSSWLDDTNINELLKNIHEQNDHENNNNDYDLHDMPLNDASLDHANMDLSTFSFSRLDLEFLQDNSISALTPSLNFDFMDDSNKR